MDLSSGELLFEPSSRRWFVQGDDEAWSVDDAQDILLLASFLPLKVAAPTTRPPVQGKAKVVPDGQSGFFLQFQSPRGEDAGEPQPLRPAVISTATWEWTYGLHADGWVECESELTVSGAREVGLRLFLPHRVGMMDKALAVTLGDEAISEVSVIRGTVTEHWIALPKEAPETCRLLLQSSYEEPVSLSEDTRSLGVVAIQMSLDRTNWKDVLAT